jgi:hypothetical protein
MLTTISRIILKARIRRDNLNRQRRFLPWENIEKMAIIIEKQDSLNKSLIDKFADETKKHVEIFYIETKEKEKSFSDWHCFSRKDRSFLNLPAKRVESEFKGRKFDAVINTCSDNNLFALALCSSLSAYLKCCQHTALGLADLIIVRSESFTLKNYLDETVRYLKMIRA